MTKYDDRYIIYVDCDRQCLDWSPNCFHCVNYHEGMCEEANSDHFGHRIASWHYACEQFRDMRERMPQ
jgi:hypothetical protein